MRTTRAIRVASTTRAATPAPTLPGLRRQTQTWARRISRRACRALAPQSLRLLARARGAAGSATPSRAALAICPKIRTAQMVHGWTSGHTVVTLEPLALVKRGRLDQPARAARGKTTWTTTCRWRLQCRRCRRPKTRCVEAWALATLAIRRLQRRTRRTPTCSAPSSSRRWRPSAPTPSAPSRLHAFLLRRRSQTSSAATSLAPRRSSSSLRLPRTQPLEEASPICWAAST
mmetsp:Transcript_22276/g.51269  ORF Transcript_22276/g.51269 Transcript_22276/m.51269 type:complete len:231 (-) Transcript_22276:278-970(-)